MMNKRLKQALGHQQSLKEEEKRQKELLRARWQEVSTVMEEYFNTDSAFMSQTVTEATKTVGILSSIIESLYKHEIPVLASTYRTLTDTPTARQDSTHFRMSETDIQESSPPGEKRKPSIRRFTKTKSAANEDYSQMVSVVQTIKREGAISFSNEFPQSMNHLGQAIMLFTQLNGPLQHCLDIDAKEQIVVTESMVSVFKNLIKAASSALEKSRKGALADQLTAESVKKIGRAHV